nr:MAG TPA: ribonucleoside-diphosphate reductase, adenosylcobalamin-dependent [Caudoviricetes sp.]
MNAEHPDIEDFIDIKKDLNLITNANISVKVSDEFMRYAVEKPGESYAMTCILRDEETGEVWHEHHITVTPSKILEHIAKNNWKMAEPGVLFWDRMENYNFIENNPYINITGVNPCVTGDTLILTDEGYVPIIDRVGLPTNVWNGHEYSIVIPKRTGKNQDILRVTLSDGSILNVTPYHKFILRESSRVVSRVEAKDLEIGSKIEKCEYPVIEGYDIPSLDMYTQGFLSGDGYISKTEGRNDRQLIKLYDVKNKLIPRLDAQLYGELKEDKNIVRLNQKYEDKTFVPPANYTKEARLEWLAGLIDSDGSYEKNSGLQITSINKDFLLQVKLMLNTLGVHSSVTLCKKACTKEMPGGTYDCKTCYRLLISKYYVYQLYRLGLTLYRVKIEDKEPNRNAGRHVQVIDVTKVGKADEVFCFNEHKNHSGIFNGVYTANCGELPLPDYGSCNLGNINLSAYVREPFEEKAWFDFTALTHDVLIYVKALNDVLIEGKEYHPLRKQRNAIRDYRQIGLGVTGLADMLIKMRIIYGSKEACQLVSEVYRVIINQSVIASVDYAVDNDCLSYKGFNVEDFCNCTFAQKVLDKETKDYVKAKGKVYNSQFLTIPPTGSVSIILGNCSSGVEPNFAWQYNRRIETIYDEPRKVLVTAGIIKEYLEYLNGRLGVEMTAEKLLKSDLPPYFVTATKGVTYMQRVAMQSACQDYIDGAISGTVNLPNDATVEDIVDLYKEAWLQGLKGITVYRVGSEREGILTEVTPVTLDETKVEPVIIPRGEKLKTLELQRGEKKAIAPDTIYYKEEVKIGCGELNLFIGYSPSEKALQDFWVKRKGNGGCERNIESTVISMSLLQRVGGSFEMLEESFKGIGSCNSFVHARSKGAKLSKGSNCGQAIFNTLYDFVKRMALQYVETDENRHVLNYAFTENIPAVFGNPCPSCGKPLHRQGGCYTCDECGYSKCD